MNHQALLQLNCPACRVAVAPFQVTTGINSCKVLSHSSKRTLVLKSRSRVKMLLEDSGVY